MSTASASASRKRASASRKRARAADDLLERTVEALLSKLPHYSQYSQFRMQPLERDDPIFAHLEARFVKQVTRHRGPNQGDPHREPPHFEVTRIEQIFSKRLQDKYLAELCDVMGLCEKKATRLEVDAVRVNSFDNLEMNEFLLYHGAPTGLIQRLAAQGLDPRNAGANFGKLFGCGTYLASLSSKSDIYTQPNERGERCELVVRACLGEAHLQKTECRDILKPPERADKRGPLSSVVAATVAQGGCVEYPEYIVYKDSQTLPQFAIYYKHTAACKCTHCWRPSTLDIKTVTEDGSEIYFKVEYDKPLRKLMELFCNRAGIARSKARFYFNDEVIGELETPADLEMENGDAIQVMVDKPDASKYLDIRTLSEDGSEIYFRLKYTTPLKKLMHKFCNHKGIPMANLRFLFDGQLLGETDTPAARGMEDGDVIDVQIVT